MELIYTDMKATYKILTGCLLVLATITIAGCSKGIVDYKKYITAADVSTGPPAITSIMMVDRTTVLTEADLSEMIIIDGTNLSGIKSIMFNDVPADLTQAYIKAQEIVVPVPRALPGVVTNKLTITTALGKTAADLKINVPALVFTGIFNEFALPGDTTTLTGDNFDIYKLTVKDARIMFGSTAAVVLAADQKSLTLVVPKSIPVAEGVIAVTTPVLTRGLSIPYRHMGQAVNTDDHLWAGGGWVTTGNGLGDPVAINGPFSHIHDVTVGQWGWYDNLWGCNVHITDPSILDSLGKYDLKFELNTNKDHPFSQMFIKFSERFNIVYAWDLYDNSASVNTYGQWQTITMDAVTVMGVLYPNSDNFFYFAINPAVQMNLDFSVSSFRLVKKQVYLQ